MYRVTARFTLTLVAVVAGLATQDSKADGLELRLTDGTRIHASEIAEANEHSVTIVSSTENIRIERALPWKHIIEADLDGQTYSALELKLSLGLSSNRDFLEPTSVSLPIVRHFTLPHGPCTACLPLAGHFRPPGRVIGVRPDPATAYADIASEIYPNGISTTEMPFALGLLRERRRLEAITPYVNPTSYAPAFPVLPPSATGADLPGATLAD